MVLDAFPFALDALPFALDALHLALDALGLALVFIMMGPHKEAWCGFHQAFGHPIRNCLALGHQLDELVKSGFLNDYLVEPQGTVTPATSEEDQRHVMPVHGEIHTISGDFSGRGCTASQRKRYVRSVISVEA